MIAIPKIYEQTKGYIGELIALQKKKDFSQHIYLQQLWNCGKNLVLTTVLTTVVNSKFFATVIFTMFEYLWAKVIFCHSLKEAVGKGIIYHRFHNCGEKDFIKYNVL